MIMFFDITLIIVFVLVLTFDIMLLSFKFIISCFAGWPFWHIIKACYSLYVCNTIYLFQALSSSDIVDLKYKNGIATLIINEVFPEDEGQYVCEATNSMGTAKTTCKLTVKRKYWIFYKKLGQSVFMKRIVLFNFPCVISCCV